MRKQLFIIVFLVLFAFINAGGEESKDDGNSCKDGEVSAVGACSCKYSQICTKKFCLCFKKAKSCDPKLPFKKNKLCACPKDTTRKCTGKYCKCAKNKPTTPTKPKKVVPPCKNDSPYLMGSCICPTFQRCRPAFAPKTAKPNEKYCTCFKKLKECPATGNFPSTNICRCEDKKKARRCKGKVCSCTNMDYCNTYKTYFSSKACICHTPFTFLTCKVTKAGIKKCKCQKLSKKCEQGKDVKDNSCFCDLKKNTYKCKEGLCRCEKKEYCPIGEYVTRKSCLCKARPTSDLEDENSEKKRVYRGYGWKNCYPDNPKDPKSKRICTCEELKCYETGRFKKYFCSCPRKHFELCNKDTKYCKCVAKYPLNKRFKGYYKFRGLVELDSKIIGSQKYEKREITVYEEAGKKKQTKRFAYIDHINGSFYIAKRPSIKDKKDEEVEMAIFDSANTDNFKDIQKQLTKKLKKSPYYDYIQGKKEIKADKKH